MCEDLKKPDVIERLPETSQLKKVAVKFKAELDAPRKRRGKSKKNFDAKSEDDDGAEYDEGTSQAGAIKTKQKNASPTGLSTAAKGTSKTQTKI